MFQPRATPPAPRPEVAPPRTMILFWSHLKRPQDFRRSDIPAEPRARVVEILRAGEIHESWMGWAECRICGEHLGSRDLTGFGFVWPEQAEHYVLEHGVWTPELDRLLEAADRARTR